MVAEIDPIVESDKESVGIPSRLVRLRHTGRIQGASYNFPMTAVL
jgi:hypothetical protein